MKAKSAEVSFHLHATEDGDRVGRALKESLGVEPTPSQQLFGHNGNIILDNRALLGKDEAEALLVRVLGSLSQGDKSSLMAELGQHIDERGTFFMRLDKQELVQGRFAIGGPDSIRLSFRLEAKGTKAEEMIRECLT